MKWPLCFDPSLCKRLRRFPTPKQRHRAGVHSDRPTDPPLHSRLAATTMAKKRKSNSAAAGAAGAVEEAHTVAAKSPVVEAVAAAAPAPAAAKPSKSSSSSSSSRSSRKSAASSSSSSSSSSSRHSLSSTGSTLDSAASFNLPSDWVELTHGGEDTTALEGLGVVPDTAYLKTRIPQTDTLRRYIRRGQQNSQTGKLSSDERQ